MFWEGNVIGAEGANAVAAESSAGAGQALAEGKTPSANIIMMSAANTAKLRMSNAINGLGPRESGKAGRQSVSTEWRKGGET